MKLTSRGDCNRSQLSKSKSTALISPMQSEEAEELDRSSMDGLSDFISVLPDECLACIFQFLSPGDRKRCSLVCRRCSVSIGDEALVLISERCRNLTRLKLRTCRDLTDAGMSAFAKNCRGLKKLSCGSCTFGAKGMNAVLDHCPALEELSVKRLRGIIDGAAAEPIGPGVAAAALKTVFLKELYNGQCFGPLIIGAKNLKSLKLFRCSGDWDKLFPLIVDRVTGIVEIHMERIQISDIGLEAISNCSNLEILHLVKAPECTNAGLGAVAGKCKLLRKLHIDGWKANRIGDQGLIAVANSCLNLQELVLIGVNPTNISLGMLASNCQNLERLALCGSDTVDHGMEALASGCPNLIKVKVKKCRGVTSEGVEWLRASRGSLAINLDTGEQLDASASDVGAQDNAVEFPPIVATQIGASAITSSSTGRSTSNKLLGLLSGRSIVACTLRRFANSNSSTSHGS
ncbi:F-box protein [Hibiscus syriacus]|uniref:F-box protein n=1 Tax=Hibiscus syriacus TaxID=106335 RepID=A0A6A2WUT4_HIBSY|nr:F-box protein [Hibiscus syriacus]